MSIEVGRKAGVGQSVPRIDGVPKVRGEFEYASDLHRDGMLFGATVRSPHASARITGIDVAAAAQMPGVHAVMTHADVPGKKTFGLDVQDQPVLASEVVRYAGEAVAIVAAESAEVARQAANAITVQYEPLPPVTDMEQALDANAPPTPDKCRRTLSGGKSRQGASCSRSACNHWVAIKRSTPPSSAGTARPASGPSGAWSCMPVS